MHEYRRFVQGELDARGWRQSDLVRRSGLSRQLVSNILRDDRDYLGQMPDAATLEALARGFGLPVETVRTAAARSLVDYSDDGTALTITLGEVSTDALLNEIRRRIDDADLPPAAAAPAPSEGAQDEASPREKTEPALAAVREFVTLDIAALRALDDLLIHHDAALLTLFAREGSTDEADKLLLEGWSNLVRSAADRAAASSWPESPTWNVAKDYLERWHARMTSTGNRLGPLTEQRRRPPMTDAEAAAYIDAVDQMNDAKKQLNQVDHERLNELRQQIEEMADALTEGETLIAQSVDETVRLADEFRATALRTYRDQLAAAEAAHEDATSSGAATEDAAIRRAKHALPRASSVSDMQAKQLAGDDRQGRDLTGNAHPHGPDRWPDGQPVYDEHWEQWKAWQQAGAPEDLWEVFISIEAQKAYDLAARFIEGPTDAERLHAAQDQDAEAPDVAGPDGGA